MAHSRAKSSALDQHRLAEWNQRKVWVPDDDKGYVAGWVVKDDPDAAISTVALASGDEMRTVETDLLTRVNPPNFDGADDIADLTYLNEASVVHNLRLRYQRGDIYTYSGLFLVAVNPYRSLPIYTSAVIESYKSARRDQNPPHVFAVAEKAWQNMMEQRDQSQSVLVTGESGAGKTENTKKVIQYLAAIAADPLPSSSSYDLLARQAHADASLARTSSRKQVNAGRAAGGKQLGQLERQILEANPILEAFGNAQTVKNHNSSRFGKFVRIFFNSAGAIAGANIDWYLLEKSRVVARSKEERAFHVFFQLLRGADADLLDALLLADEARAGTTAFEYLKHSRQEVDGMDDREEWRALVRALDTVGFSSDEQLSLFRIIATILHLGQLTLALAGSSTSSSSVSAHLSSRTALEKAAFLLGVPADALSTALLRPRVRAGREWVTQARSRDQVVAEVGALAKALYEKNFGALVDRINTSLTAGKGAGGGGGGGGGGAKTFIGVLDIAGFEIFETNGFEQLCINLNNEKLQQFFNHHMFVLEQEEYAREDIRWDFVNFGLELQPTIDLIESTNPMGILACLDDASIMPKATDATFTDKLHQLASEKPTPTPFTKYSPSRLSQGFTVSHYAGKVEYRTDGWLDKNRDPLNDNITSLLAQSTDGYVAGLFAEFAESDAAASGSAFLEGGGAAAAGPRMRVRKGAFRTVGQRHKEQLATLLTQLNSTQPHFVRCIVPNLHKSPSEIDVPLVLDQLRCNGVLEGIRIARLGYPNRLPFSEFRRRFELLAPAGAIPKGFVDGAQACQTILEHCELDPGAYRLGLTKCFFKAGILAELEERRDDVLSGIVSRLQATCRRFVARRQAVKVLHRAHAVRTIQRNARVYAQLRAWPWWPLFQRVRPLLAAARSDDELRRQAAELAAAKERAEAEERERARLEQVRDEMARAQDELARELEGERALAVEKEALLVRSQERQAALQDALGAAEADYETVSAQLDRALEAKRAADERLAGLGDAYANQTKLVETLQEAQAAWKAREAELASQTSVQTAEWERIVAERETAVSTVADLKRQLSELGQDRRREQERANAAVKSLEDRLASETKASSEARQKFVALETEARAVKAEVTALQRAQRDDEENLRAKEAELARLRTDSTTIREQLADATEHARKAASELAALQQELASQRSALQSSRSAEAKAAADLLALKKLVDEQASDQQRTAELAKMREADIQDLKFQLSKTTSDLSLARRESAQQAERLTTDLDAARSEASEARSQQRELERKSAAQAASIAQLEARVEDYAQAQQAHELQFELLRTETAEQMLQAREKWEKELQDTRAQFQVLEDDAVQARREREAALRDVEAYKALLEAEQESVRKHVAGKAKLESQIEQQHLVLADLDKINGDLRAELASTKARLVVAEEKAGRTVVEHIRVLEEAQRLQNAEMDRMRGERDKRDAYVRTLERARTALTQSLEDLQHEREAERRAAFTKKTPRDTTAERLAEELASERKVRELAEVNVHLQALLDSQKGENADLKRRNAQTERELQRVAASDPEESLVSPSKSYAAFAPPTLRDPAPRYMGESRVANALPEPPAPRTNGYKAEGTFGSGYGSVHASRTSVDLKRASLQFPSSTSPVPASPKRRMWE
ncbi:hypothetical protein Rhopal_001124-T1 [Rhodotorula paludigena]|uniref:Nonmuscle myosin heavy chain b n=1 Tax=Rhodotorula paludigena TaxID=86838 RepID=A0AAV5GFM0_9BASI|nr:hypothetical protein Rhopal_001124-T1 [Rhodotorula paludigena]